MEFNCLDIQEIIGFDWDTGNILKNKIRVISARPISKKERDFYENYTRI